MTFLNPLVLLGLAAAAIPVLLHLFNLRKLQKIEFSTLAFLNELQKTKIRRLKLRQLLLLVLRTMLVVLVVTAFSRPTLKSSYVSGTSARAKTTAVIILDDAYSMTSRDEDGQLLKQAKEEATKILDVMKDGDEIAVERVSDVGSQQPAEPPAPIRDFAVVRARIQEVLPTYVHRTIEDALRYSAKLLSSSKNLNKEIYVFSDLKTGSLASRLRGNQTDGIFPTEIRFFLLPAGKKTRQNVGIESVTLKNSLFGVGKPVTLKVKVANWGSQDVKNDVVSVFLNGTRVSEKALDIQAQHSVETEFSVTPKSTGYLDGMVELQDDDLDFDNRRFFTIYIPERLKILLVGFPADLRYLQLALSAKSTEGESVVQLSSVTADRLSSNDIDAADVAIFANVRDLSSAQKSAIRSFVEVGGGILCFAGSKIDSASFYSSWVSNLRLPQISNVVRLPAHSDQSTSVLEFDRVDFNHPIFDGMFEDEVLRSESTRLPQRAARRTLESPTIESYVRFRPSAQSVPIITLSDGSPFMFEQRIEQGVAVVFCVSATKDWSDFPLKGLFVPMLHRSTVFAAQQQNLPYEVMAGDEATLELKEKGLTRVVVQNPENVDFIANVSASPRGGRLHFLGTTIPGIYTVQSENQVLKKFVVTLDPRASMTMKADDASMEAMFKRLGIPEAAVRSIDRKSDTIQIVAESRVGLELWKYFVAAALVIGIAELLVARTRKRELSSEGYPLKTT